MKTRFRAPPGWVAGLLSLAVVSATVYAGTAQNNPPRAGGGGGGTVTTDATLTGNGAPATPLHAIPTFGADTTVSINNAISVPVTSLETITSLTATGSGAEASQWLIKVLTAGAQVSAMTIGPNQTQFRAGTIAAPGVSVGGTNAGISLVSGKTIISNFGQSVLALDYGAGTANYGVNNLQLGVDLLSGIQRLSNDVQVYATRDVTVGADSALVTTAVAGFLELPTCPGPPTGSYTPRSGHASFVIDTTNKKLCYQFAAGTWECSAAFTP